MQKSRQQSPQTSLAPLHFPGVLETTYKMPWKDAESRLLATSCNNPVEAAYCDVDGWQFVTQPPAQQTICTRMLSPHLMHALMQLIILLRSGQFSNLPEEKLSRATPQCALSVLTSWPRGIMYCSMFLNLVSISLGELSRCLARIRIPRRAVLYPLAAPAPKSGETTPPPHSSFGNVEGKEARNLQSL